MLPPSCSGIPTLAGILWHQGESDSGEARTAERYGARLTEVIRGLRADLSEFAMVAAAAGDGGEENGTGDEGGQDVDGEHVEGGGEGRRGGGVGGEGTTRPRIPFIIGELGHFVLPEERRRRVEAQCESTQGVASPLPVPASSSAALAAACGGNWDSRFDFAGTVQAELRRVAATEPGCGLVSSAALVDRGDQLHFDAPSLAVLGRRYAASWRATAAAAAAATAEAAVRVGEVKR